MVLSGYLGILEGGVCLSAEVKEASISECIIHLFVKSANKIMGVKTKINKLKLNNILLIIFDYLHTYIVAKEL